MLAFNVILDLLTAMFCKKKFAASVLSSESYIF